MFIQLCVLAEFGLGLAIPALMWGQQRKGQRVMEIHEYLIRHFALIASLRADPHAFFVHTFYHAEELGLSEDDVCAHISSMLCAYEMYMCPVPLTVRGILERYHAANSPNPAVLSREGITYPLNLPPGRRSCVCGGQEHVHYPANSIVGPRGGVFQTPRGGGPSSPEDSKVALVLCLGPAGSGGSDARGRHGERLRSPTEITPQ